MGRPAPVLALWLAAAALVTGCEYYDKPLRPLPAGFEMTTMDGRVLTPEALRGKPWVINLWVPG